MPAEKLVRDLLDARIPAERLRVETDPEALDHFLDEKLDEEIVELRTSDFSDTGEFADVVEILMAIARRRGVPWDEVERVRVKKAAERGGFSRGLIYAIET